MFRLRRLSSDSGAPIHSIFLPSAALCCCSPWFGLSVRHCYRPWRNPVPISWTMSPHFWLHGCAGLSAAAKGASKTAQPACPAQSATHGMGSCGSHRTGLWGVVGRAGARATRAVASWLSPGSRRGRLSFSRKRGGSYRLRAAGRAAQADPRVKQAQCPIQAWGWLSAQAGVAPPSPQKRPPSGRPESQIRRGHCRSTASAR